MPLTQKEFEAKYPLIIDWIKQTLADHKSQASTVASLHFKRLPKYFSPELLAYAKVIYVDIAPTPPLSKIGLNQFSDFENMKADGITYLDSFFVRKEAQHDESLHFHELIHVVQWKLLGAEKFVAAYADGLERFGYRESPLEKIAYDAQGTFNTYPQPFDVEKLVKSHLDSLSKLKS